MGMIAGLGSAIGGIGSALIGSGAAGQASQQQQQAQMMALMLQEQRYEQASAALKPYMDAGTGALPTLSNLLTPGYSADQLKQMPGFKFQSDWGNLSATNALAAQGLGGSKGPLASAISQFNNGLAGTYWQNSVNALQNFSNMGASATGAFANMATNNGNAMASTLGNIGNAQASGTLGSANALAGGLSSAMNGIGGAAMMSGLGSGGLYGSRAGIMQLPNFLNPNSSLTGL